MAGDVPSPGRRVGLEQDQGRPAVLPLRWRSTGGTGPATFAEVKGQDHVTEPLRQALRSGRVQPRLPVQRAARLRQDVERPDPGPVAELRAGPDPRSVRQVRFVRGARPVRAGQHRRHRDRRRVARRRRRRAGTCASGPSTRRSPRRFKIYIIDEAHMVTGAGFNALLKLVEEPPPHLKFVFATTEPEKVIATIRSRTHHYPFRLVPPAVLRELLEEILASRGGQLRARRAARRHPGRGRLGAGLAVRPRPAASPGADEAGLRYDRAIALLGYTDDAPARRDGRGVRGRGRRRGLPGRRPGGRGRPRSAPVRRRPARPAARPDRARRRAGRRRHRAARRARPTGWTGCASRPPSFGQDRLDQGRRDRSARAWSRCAAPPRRGCCSS